MVSTMSRLKAAALAALRTANIEARRAAPHDAKGIQRQLLAQAEARHIIDAGAYYGEWTAFYRAAFPAATVHAFEPFPASLAALRAKFAHDPRVKIIPAALSDTPGERTFHSNNDAPTNSLLAAHERVGELLAEPELVAPRERLRVQVTNLDTYAQQEKIDRIAVLKMDIQGAELSALRGAHALLRGSRIDLIYSEILLAPHYKDQPHYFELCKALHDLGYALFGLYNLFPQPSGRMGWCDAIFLSPPIWARLAENANRPSGGK